MERNIRRTKIIQAIKMPAIVEEEKRKVEASIRENAAKKGWTKESLEQAASEAKERGDNAEAR